MTEIPEPPDLGPLDALLMSVPGVHGVGGTPKRYDVHILSEELRDTVLRILHENGFRGAVNCIVEPRGRLL